MPTVLQKERPALYPHWKDTDRSHSVKFYFTKRTKTKNEYMLEKSHKIRSECDEDLESRFTYLYYLCCAVFLQRNL